MCRQAGHVASLYHFIDVSTFYLITCVLNTAYLYFFRLGIPIYQCPLGGAVCLVIQPVLPDSPANASLLLLIDLLLYFAWQCMRTQCALVAGVAITSRCDEDVSPPHTHTLTHFCGCRHSFPVSWEGHENWQDEPRDAQISLSLCQCMHAELMRTSKSSSRIS